MKRQRALAGVRNGTEAINAFICIANVASTMRDNSCCLKALLQVLDEQRGLGGFSVVGSSDADRKADDVADYVNCLLQKAPSTGAELRRMDGDQNIPINNR